MAKSDADVRRNGRFGYWTLAGFYFFFGVLTLLLHRGEATLKMDRLIYDNWVRFGQSAPPSKYVVVGIDSESVEAKGRWPWPRNDQAQIIDNLTDAGAAIILIDILYSEASANNPEHDLALAQSIQRSNRVILPVHTEGRDDEIRNGETLPIPVILEASRDLGHVFFPIAVSYTHLTLPTNREV